MLRDVPAVTAEFFSIYVEHTDNGKHISCEDVEPNHPISAKHSNLRKKKKKKKKSPFVTKRNCDL
jgi:hypothetical protein